MSDIAIRFDGLLLAAALAIAASVYFLVAVGAALVRLAGRQSTDRPLRIARTASVFGLLNVAALGLLLTYMTLTETPAEGPDRIDWLTIPCVALFVLGCIVIARRKATAS